jgi:hypothetical protein
VFDRVIRSRLRLGKPGDQFVVPLGERVCFLLLCPVFRCKARIRPAQIGDFLLQETNAMPILQVFLFNITNAPVGFVLDR